MGRPRSEMDRAINTPAPIPADRLRARNFVSACSASPDSLIYFLLNVGDGDTQLVLLPADDRGIRRALVIDVATTRKLPSLVESLADRNLIQEPADGTLFPVVVGTHPHDDHIGGMPEFLDRFSGLIGEYWEPGYYHPSARYVETLRALEDGGLQHLQPTSGTSRFIGKVKLTALSPGIVLRNRFDSYGTQINDASIALRLEFPAARISQHGENRDYLRIRDPWSLILGADAQTTSWAQTILDFPHLERREGPLYKELSIALGGDLLKGQVFKVPHHGSKHGLNVELVERIGPKLTLVSCTRGDGRYGFPHGLALDAIREARQPVAANRMPRKPDHVLGIHYTSAVDDDVPPQPLGSIALIVPPNRGSRVRLWRLGDEPTEMVQLDSARE